MKFGQELQVRTPRAARPLLQPVLSMQMTSRPGEQVFESNPRRSGAAETVSWGPRALLGMFALP